MQKDMSVGIRTRYYFKYQGLHRIFYFNLAVYAVYLFFCFLYYFVLFKAIFFRNFNGAFKKYYSETI